MYGSARPIEMREGAADLRHLHQRERALHHPRAARAADDDQRPSRLDRALDRARDLLADDHPHAAADEAVLHRRDDAVDAVDRSGRDDDGVLEPGGFDARLEACLYGLVSVKVQRIGRGQTLVVLHPVAVEEHAQAIGGVDAEVMRALRADVEVGREILVVDDLRAARTLHPQAFGDAAGFSFGAAAIGLRAFLNHAIQRQLNISDCRFQIAD